MIKLAHFIDILIGLMAGLFAGLFIGAVHEHRFYAWIMKINATPWYTSLVLEGAICAVMIIILVAARVLLHRLVKRQREKDRRSFGPDKEE
ncbi:MAG: hypothetical protein IJ806_07070 [Ruminococcus sp.]|nr:hypothetical protein [Ruminococcus sp.]